MLKESLLILSKTKRQVNILLGIIKILMDFYVFYVAHFLIHCMHLLF